MPDANTMAFGGVATGNINAQLAAKVIGTLNISGDKSCWIAMAPMTGKKVAVVAKLLVNSVKKMTNPVVRIINNINFDVPIAETVSPNHKANPEPETADAKLNPPPNNINTPQGKRVTSGQVISWYCSFSPDGIMNNNIAAAMAIIASLTPVTPSISLTGRRNIQAITTPKNISATRFSAVDTGPNSDLSCCKCASTLASACIFT